MMRPLTVKQVQACETATTPRCECRCGGRLHGAGRAVTREQLSELPLDDPHYRPSLTKRAAVQKLRCIIDGAIAQVTCFGDIDHARELYWTLLGVKAYCIIQIRGEGHGNSSRA